MKELGISLGSAYLWTKGIKISEDQKRAINIRSAKSAFTPARREKQRKLAMACLAPYWRKEKYTKEDLLNKIKEFYAREGRIPLKREFNMYGEYQRRFGSWNNAIQLAGFSANPVVFSKRYRSIDGHLCDSLAEKIIDDFLYLSSIPHERSVAYPENPKFKADFTVRGTFIEYFGLANEVDSYDKGILRKRKICSENGIPLIELYPADLFKSDRFQALLGPLR